MLLQRRDHIKLNCLFDTLYHGFDGGWRTYIYTQLLKLCQELTPFKYQEHFKIVDNNSR